MKKIISIILLIAAIFTLSVFADETKPVTVTLNGQVVDCASYGQEATIVEGRTLVPLRAIFEALGASVEWDGETRKVSSTRGNVMITLAVGENSLQKHILYDGFIVETIIIPLDVPAQIMNGRTLVPVRAVSESYGVSVEWEADTKNVVLSSGKSDYFEYLNGVLEDIEPKSSLDLEILGYADVFPISAATVRSYVMTACSSGQDVTDENTLDAFETLYKQDAALVEFAFDEEIVLDEKDINGIKASVAGLQLQLGENYEKAFAESPYTKYYYYLNTALYQTVYAKMSESFLDGRDEEMHSKTVKYLEDNGYVRAKHILIQFPGMDEGREPTENEKTKAFNEALEALVKVKAMKDVSEFDALVEEYNDDPGMTYNPDGYYFTKGEMVEPFEEATYALEEGETSSLVETVYGYHIILRLPLVDEALVDSSVYGVAVKNALFETIIENSENIEVRFLDNYVERIKDFEEEYKEMMAPKQ